MAGIDFSTTSTPLNDGVLQLENGVAMDSTLRNVADQLNTISTLKLSTTSAQFTSPLRITTDDPSDFYLDCEDGATNNRFSITRNTASQQVNLNFASNPAGSTTIVGAIRTYVDGTNLSEVMAFREDGNVGIGTTNPTNAVSIERTTGNAVLSLQGNAGTFISISRFSNNSTRPRLELYKSRGTISTPAVIQTNDELGSVDFYGYDGSANQRVGILFVTAESVVGSTITPQMGFGLGTSAGANTFKMVIKNDGNVTIGNELNTLGARLGIKGSGSTSSTTSLLVQNSSGTTQFSVGDSGIINGVNNKLNIYNSGNQLIIQNPVVGNYFYIGPSNVCGVDSSFSTPSLQAGNLIINGGSSYQGSVMTLSNFVGSNTGTNYGLRINSQYTNNGAGGPNYGKQVSFYDNLTPNNIQMDMTFAYVYPTINYQGTANGAVVGYDFNPTITAVTANTSIRAFQSSTGGVYINTTSYDASAILQADSTTQGFLPPRMTDAQIRAIVAPTNGLVAYNTDINHLCCYQAGAWVKFSHTPM